MLAMVTEEGEVDLAPLMWQEVPDPSPGPGEVLIDVLASGVNRVDLLKRRGKHPPPRAAPYVGLEVSGTIASAHASDR